MTARLKALALFRPLSRAHLFIPRRGVTASLARAVRPDGRFGGPIVPTEADEARALRFIAGTPLAGNAQVRALLQPVLQQGRGLGCHAGSALSGSELSMDERLVAARDVSLACRVAWAVDEPAVSDEQALSLVCSARGEAGVPLSLMHDLLDVRPGLLSPVARLSIAAAAGAATSLLVSPELAAELLSGADPRTMRGRGILRELALNPAVGPDVRSEAAHAATRSWGRERRAAALFHAGNVEPVSPHCDAAGLLPAQREYLLAWASGGYPHDSWTTSTWSSALDRAKPAVLRRLDAAGGLPEARSGVLSPGLAVARTVQHLGPRREPLSWLAGQSLPATIGGTSPASPSRGGLMDQLVSAIVWKVPVEEDQLPHRLLLVTAAARSLRAELGDDLRAWEAYAALAPEWKGTFGDLVTASRALA